MKKSIVSSLLIITLLTGCGSASVEQGADTTASAPTVDAAAEEEEESISESKAEGTSPKTDFYVYINAEALKEHAAEEPADGKVDIDNDGWNRLSEINAKIKEEEDVYLKQVLSDPTTAGKSDLEGIIATAAKLLTDHESRNAQGVSPIQSYADKIISAASAHDVMLACAEIQAETGLTIFYGIGSDVDDTTCTHILDLPYYAALFSSSFGDDYPTQKANCQNMVQKAFVQLGFSEEEAAKRAEANMAFDEAINAAATYDGDDVTDLSAVSAAMPNLYLSEALPLYGIENITTIGAGILSGELYCLNQVATDENLYGLQSYALFNLFITAGQYLDDTSSVLATQVGTLESGVVVDGVDGYISSDMDQDQLLALYHKLVRYELGDRYSDTHVTEEIVSMVKDDLEKIFDWYREAITSRTWLSEDSKEKALAKLDNCIVDVGKSTVQIYHDKDATSFAAYVFSGLKANQDVQARLVADPEFYRYLWPSTTGPDITNASYSVHENSMHINAAILQEPYYSADASQGENAAGLLFTLAHECSHAFDPSGFKYDEYGHLTDSWADADKTAYSSLTDLVGPYYANFPYAENKIQSADATLNENCADLAAMRYIMDYLKNDEDKKEAMEHFAYLWAETHSNAYYEKMESSAAHSFGRTRVNGVVASVDDFYHIYDVVEGDPMYVAPENRPSIW